MKFKFVCSFFIYKNCFSTVFLILNLRKLRKRKVFDAKTVCRRLQDDLSAALKDCKISQRDLDAAQKEVEDLKQRLQNYVSEVQRIEDLLSQKVKSKIASLIENQLSFDAHDQVKL